MIMVIAEGVKDMMPEGRSKEKGTIETELDGKMMTGIDSDISDSGDVMGNDCRDFYG